MWGFFIVLFCPFCPFCPLDILFVKLTMLHLFFNLQQGSTECIEGGRYKLVSDGDNNNMIMLAMILIILVALIVGWIDGSLEGYEGLFSR